MSLIYTPKGRAREYSPFALNVYTGGCDHACKYCYCRSLGAWSVNAKPRDLKGLDREATQINEQILLSFLSDPYHAANDVHKNTRKALQVLRAASCSVAILTKGGERCLQDIDIFSAWPEGRVKVGATLTFATAKKSQKEEPGAATPADRIHALKALHEAGVSTWASVEPVIEPDESLSVIANSLEYCDAYKVGTLNHDHRSKGVDWRRFGVEAVTLIRGLGKKVYVKHDLRPYLPDGFLLESEADMNSLNLPLRPQQPTLIE